MRLIDADRAAEQIKKSDMTNREKIALLLCLSDAPTIPPPPNDPLTLEELREMDGEPVWITPAVKGGRIPERWMLMACFLPEDRVYLFMPYGGMVQAYPAMSYGKTWLAYRRKPEEGAK